jgi:sterol O-acyltransferase
MTVNGHLQYISVQSQTLLDELRPATLNVGGWDQALKDAKSHRAEIDASTGITDSTTSTPSGTPDVLEGMSTSYVDPPTALALRKRLAAVSLETSGNFSSVNSTTSVSSNGTNTPSFYPIVDGHPPPPVDPHPLVDHPDQEISGLAKDYSELQSELTSSGPHYVTWPNNISLRNFAVYQLIPTLVYELEYPRTDRRVLFSFLESWPLTLYFTVFDLYTYSRKRLARLSRYFPLSRIL